MDTYLLKFIGYLPEKCGNTKVFKSYSLSVSIVFHNILEFLLDKEVSQIYDFVY